MPTISFRTPCRALFAMGALLTASHAQAALYDGSLGTSPAAQGWTSVIAAPFASETLGNGGVTLDTSFSNALQSGYSLFLPNVDSSTGYSLSLTAQLNSESHTGNSNRAGFSVILLDNIHQGVEIGFWTDQVWAQAVGFTKAESSAFDTTNLTTYVLTLQSGNYSLSVNNSTILSGSMRDYSAFGTPYNLNNFLFIGDDTSSAKASVKINQVAQVATVPLPSSGFLMFGPVLAGGFMLSRRRNIGWVEERTQTFLNNRH